jgi:hypothetical protein
MMAWILWYNSTNPRSFLLKKKLKHLIIFHYVKIFLLEKGRKATKRRTQRRTSTREEPREGSPSGQPSMQPSTSRGGTSRFIVKFSFFFFNFIFYSLKMVIFMVMIIIFYLLLFFVFSGKGKNVCSTPDFNSLIFDIFI